PMVLSLSPGPAVIEKAWHLEKYANMWRITDDFWDDWDLLKAMFERCEVWQKHVGGGNWPDCDMLPFGKLGWGWGTERTSRFTREEERTMLSLWCIFRSPLMIGTDLTQLDGEVKEMLTNREILAVHSSGQGAFQLMRDDRQCVWVSSGGGCPAAGRDVYVALFNLADDDSEVAVALNELPGIDGKASYGVRDLWRGKDLFPLAGDAILSLGLKAHDAAVLRIAR
ncbi:MAG: hypothetical protein ILP18_09640, partial [Treponema sp.]|nr:hypothetical protein [Treponema sp.]